MTIMGHTTAIETDTHAKLVLLEELCPVIIDECCIGLDLVLHDIPHFSKLPLELKDSLVERDTRQQGLSAVPDK